MARIKIKRPKPKRKPGSRAGLTREKIALAAAKQIEADEAAFSFRKLASSLGVTPTTVSSHFKGGLADLEDEIVRVIFDHASAPFKPNRAPNDYIEELFNMTLGNLKNNPTIALMTIRRLTRNPMLSSRLPERVLGSLEALGLAPRKIAPAYQATLQALFGLILSGPARLLTKAASDPSSLSESESPHLCEYREAIVEEQAQAAAWKPDPSTVKAAVARLMKELKVV